MKKLELDAIRQQRYHGSFPGTLRLVSEIAVSRAEVPKCGVLSAAEGVTSGEYERLVMRLATARIDLLHSMGTTLRMMSGAMSRVNGNKVNEKSVESWKKLFRTRLDEAIDEERRRHKKKFAQRRKKIASGFAFAASDQATVTSNGGR